MNLKNYHHDAWKIIEKGFDADNVRASESIFSIGNGLMGQRANFEEAYSGKTLHGSYVAGVYYPDKTRVGWWKNGYPEYFAKVLNSAFWIGIKVFVDGEELDLITCKVLDFYRELNMHEGTLIRTFTVEMPSGKQISVEAKRFLSLVDTEMGVINYSVKAVNGDCTIMFEPYINGDVKNEDSNYDEKFWTLVSQKENYLQMQTKKTAFDVAWRMQNQYELNHKEMKIDAKPFQKDALVGEMIEQPLKKGDVLTIKKYVAVLSSQHHNVNDLERNSVNVLEKAVAKGYEKMVQEHVAAWAKKMGGERHPN